MCIVFLFLFKPVFFFSALFVFCNFLHLKKSDRVSCSQGWPPTSYVAKAGLELMIFLPLPPKCWDSRCISCLAGKYSFCVFLLCSTAIEPRVWPVLGEHSTIELHPSSPVLLKKKSSLHYFFNILK